MERQETVFLQVITGAETDKKGSRYFYEVESMEVVDPYDNSVKDQGEGTMLTLLTCENSGTMRLTVRCSLKEAVE